MFETDTFIIDAVKTPGLIHATNLTDESAATTTALLKDNNEKYQIFFTTADPMGLINGTTHNPTPPPPPHPKRSQAYQPLKVYLHNHIAHHDLTLWALGAKPEVLRSQHERNTRYMRDAMIIVEPLVLDLEDDVIFTKCLGREENFRNYEKFFLGQINQKGYQAVLQKYLVGDGQIANDMMFRIYMGKCYPK